jgi:hypothetical protein
MSLRDDTLDVCFEVDKIVNTLNVRETIYNLSFSTKSVMKTVSEKLIELDNTEWYRELFNDRRNGQKCHCAMIHWTYVFQQIKSIYMLYFVQMK